MKTLIAILALALLPLVAGAESTLTFNWTANPAAEKVTEYRLRTRVGTLWTLVATVPGTEATVPFKEGMYRISAFNGKEGPPSSTITVDPVVVPPTPVDPPTAPTGFKVTVTVEVIPAPPPAE